VEQASCGGVGVFNATLRVDDQHGHRCCADDVAQQLFTVAQGGLILGQLLDHAVEITGQLANFILTANLGLSLRVPRGEALYGLADSGQAAGHQSRIKKIEEQAQQQQENQDLP